ncbi:MAG: hypothetical protein ACJ77K_04715 [Bacteroidia bacterium]
MRHSLIILSSFVLLFSSCKSLLYPEYRGKDYYEISNGRHLFFDKYKMQEIAVSKGIYRSNAADTCTCVYRLEKADNRYCMSDLIIGIHLDINLSSRDLYTGIPRDGSIEKIVKINFFLEGKGGNTVALDRYMRNDTLLRDKIVYFSTDSIPTVPPADYTLYSHDPRCFDEYSVRDLRSFVQGFNAKRFDDKLNPLDTYYFLFAVSSSCPYNIADYKDISTEILLRAGKHERKVYFSTPLHRSTIPDY